MTDRRELPVIPEGAVPAEVADATERTTVPPDVSDVRAYAVRVSKDTMQPVFRPGMILVVSPGERISNGDHVYAHLGNGEHVLAVASKSSGGWIFSFANPNYTPRFYQEREVDNMDRVLWAKLAER